MFNAILDAIIDSLKILPILFLSYTLIAVIEAKGANKLQNGKFLNGVYSPIISSAIGIIPQCGFTVVATDLYSKKKITAASLLAIFIATSDEAIPLFFANSDSLISLAKLLIIKFVYAIVVGYATLLILKILTKSKNKDFGIDNKLNTIKEHTLEKKEHEHEGCCGHHIEADSKSFWHFMWHPIKHVIKIFIFILLVNALFGITLYYLGIEKLSTLLLNNSIFQPFLIALIGLIPNCASSVVITSLYLNGGISFAGCVAGLCANAGIALAVLFKTNKNIKGNILITLSLYLLSALLGVIVYILKI